MFPQKSPVKSGVDSKTYPLGETNALPADGGAMALVALSHTPLEHKIYLSMLSGTSREAIRTFNTRELMALANIRSPGTVRRGLGAC